jgi:hypothetical protein
MVFWSEFLISLAKQIGVGLLFGLLFVFPLFALLTAYEYRPVVRLSRLRCPHCRTLFGFRAARLARCSYRHDFENAHSDAAREFGQGVLIDFDSIWNVTCPGCQCTACYDFDSNRLAVDQPKDGDCMSTFRMNRIDPPEWARQPVRNITGVTTAEYAAIQRNRDELLRIVHREVEDYLNTPGLFGEGESFPDRLRMTGEYYIGDESYIAHHNPAWFQISVKCRCLERPKSGLARDDNYLGLEVWLKCVPERMSSFDVFRNTDTSSI